MLGIYGIYRSSCICGLLGVCLQHGRAFEWNRNWRHLCGQEFQASLCQRIQGYKGISEPGSYLRDISLCFLFTEVFIYRFLILLRKSVRLAEHLYEFSIIRANIICFAFPSRFFAWRYWLIFTAVVINIIRQSALHHECDLAHGVISGRHSSLPIQRFTFREHHANLLA